MRMVYVTAQRVRSETEEGINAYLYSHSDAPWPSPPPHPEDGAGGCGRCVNTHLAVENVGGNAVNSYLDLVGPEHVPFTRFLDLILKMAIAAQLQPIPWEVSDGDCWVRFAVDQTVLAKASWRSELALLFKACEDLYNAEIPVAPPTH